MKLWRRHQLVTAFAAYPEYRVPEVAVIGKPRYDMINYYSIAEMNVTRIIAKGTPVELGQSAGSGAAGSA
jgi:hypothetical protein